MTEAPAVLVSDRRAIQPGDALRDALLDSRQRWRDLVNMAADLAFETDAEGRFVFLAPDPILGWPAGSLLGQPAEQLLEETAAGGVFNPFRPEGPVRRQRAWLRRPDGSTVCLSFAVAPLLDAAGRVVGSRGVAQDVSEHDRREAAIAAALRRTEVMDHIMACMRREVLAPRMMEAALEALAQATGSEGVAVLDTVGEGMEPCVVHAFGDVAPSVLPRAATLLRGGSDDPAGGEAADGRRVLVCPAQTRFGEEIGLVLARAPGMRAWDADDETLVSSSAALVRVVLEHGSIQREMVRQARIDPLTGLLNRRAFMDDMARRIDRLEVEGLPGALMFIDLDNFKTLNDTLGHDAGDEALRVAARLLRSSTRPSDLVARLGGDEFAVWLDGADEFVAAERAEALRAEAPRALAPLTGGRVGPVTMSIGIAARWPGRGEDVEALLVRADQAMYAVKRAGRGHWRVSPAGDVR
ncbi:MAG: GGDEF domain-containing protein [Alphaproteobacteria bacterium]|nr:GGDEF domain-containing protein [Alphaproteobacteria bacterium]